MWKKHVCQCLGWAVLGSGACLAGYCAYKYDIFGNSNLLAGKENLKEIKSTEIDISDSLTPDIAESEETQKKPTTDSFQQTQQENVVTNQINVSTSKNSESNVDFNSSNKAKTTDKNEKIFYEFVASASDEHSQETPSQEYALDKCDIEDSCVETIENINIYSFVTSRSDLKKHGKDKSFQNNKKYLIEISLEHESKLLLAENEKFKVTWDNIAVTEISSNSLKKIDLPENN